MSRRMTTSILVLLMLGLVSAVGQAAPQIKAAKPVSVSLQQGRIVTVELQGDKLREAKSAVVYSLRSDQPIRGLSAKLGQGNDRKRKLTLKAGTNVKPGTYRVMLTSRGKKVLVPLKFRVTARKTAQSKPKPKAPAKITSSSPTPNNSLRISAAKKETRRVNKEKPKIPGAQIPRSGEPDNPTLTQIQLYYNNNGQGSYDFTYADTVRIYVTRGGGNPSHYRVSESAGFTGADWKVFRGYQPITVTFASDTPGEKTIYFQLMNGVGQSEVASDSITYEGPLVSQVHDLSGLLLNQFLELAQANGYGFTAERLSGAGECLQRIDTRPSVGGWSMQAKGELIPTLEVFGAPPQLDADSDSPGLGRPISCQFRVLDGKMLREGWRIIDTSVFDYYAATNPCVGVSLLDMPSGIDRNPGYRIVITAYQGELYCGVQARENAWARIMRIKLEGPSNEDWSMALQP